MYIRIQLRRVVEVANWVFEFDRAVVWRRMIPAEVG